MGKVKKMDKIDKELEKENMLDKIEGKGRQEWRVIAQEGNTSIIGLYKNYIGCNDDYELAEIRIKFRDDD